MASWDEIKHKVEQNGNVVTFTMEELKNAHGASRLGVNVREEISKTLAGMGLGHVPEQLPTYQNELVRLYKKGTPAGDLITTVLTPGEQSDTKLVQQFSSTGTDYAAIVQKIKEIIGD